MTKKGQTTNVIIGAVGIVMGLIFLGILLTMSMTVSNDIREEQGESNCIDASGYWNTSSQQCETSAVDDTVVAGNPTAYNSSTDVLEGGANFSGQMGAIFLVAAVGIIIAVLLGAFAFVRFKM